MACPRAVIDWEAVCEQALSFCHARLGRRKKPSVAAKEAVKNKLSEAVQEGETSETKRTQVASTTMWVEVQSSKQGRAWQNLRQGDSGALAARRPLEGSEGMPQPAVAAMGGTSQSLEVTLSTVSSEASEASEST